MQTPIDVIADAHVEALVQLQPELATSLGETGYDHQWSDYSPAGHEAQAQLNEQTLAKLAMAPAMFANDEITVAAMRERLGLALERFEAGDHYRDLNNIASPVQEIRDTFALMPTDSPEAWHNIAERLRNVPQALAGFTTTLREGLQRGIVPSARPVHDCIAQAQDLASQDSLFFALAKQAPQPEQVASAARVAAEAYGSFAEFLAEEFASHCPEHDAVGREHYQRASRQWLGTAVDLDETYEWGVEALRGIAQEQEELARQIAGPSASVKDAMDQLRKDPQRTIHGTQALKAWMQTTADDAIRELNGKYFDIPDPLLTVEACIAPTQTGGIYYTAPSEDFSRPGRMWWSVPAGVNDFQAWEEKTTVYHEGVPGHHLQLGQAVYNCDELNRWRRSICWVSGHGEGWALYAERLMEEFGFLDDPGDRFGMLDSQRLRATRVVLDLGVHLGKPALPEYGDGPWTYDSAWRFLRDNVAMEENFLRFEYHRYLSWPGQAPSYRIGQRIWEEIRAEHAQAANFDLKAFHTKALNLGSLPLDVLRDALRS